MRSPRSSHVLPTALSIAIPAAALLASCTRPASPLLAALFHRNDYPRPALLEAAVRLVEEDLAER